VTREEEEKKDYERRLTTPVTITVATDEDLEKREKEIEVADKIADEYAS